MGVGVVIALHQECAVIKTIMQGSCIAIKFIWGAYVSSNQIAEYVKSNLLTNIKRVILAISLINVR